MTISEFKLWLSQFDDNAEVHCVCVNGRDTTKFQGKEYHDYDFVDFTNNEFVKENDPRFGKKMLCLGLTE